MTWTPDPAQYDFGRPFPGEHVVRLICQSKIWTALTEPHQRKRIFEPGCGTGRILLPLAQSFPEGVFMGADTYDDALAVCSSRARAMGITNIRLANSDVMDLDWSESLDALIHSSVLHSIIDWQSALDKLVSMLKPEGFFVLIGDSGDIYDESIGREPLGGSDATLGAFWREYREQRTKLGIESPESSQRGCRWDLDSTEITDRLRELGFREIEKSQVLWNQPFTVFELLSIIEKRCYSAMFTVDEKKYSELTAHMDARFSAEGSDLTISRHKAVARFYSRKV